MSEKRWYILVDTAGNQLDGFWSDDTVMLFAYKPDGTLVSERPLDAPKTEANCGYRYVGEQKATW